MRGYFMESLRDGGWVKEMSETKSMDRIIRILDDELTQLMDSGLYREAEKTRYRLEVYMDMRNKAKELRGKLDDG